MLSHNAKWTLWPQKGRHILYILCSPQKIAICKIFKSPTCYRVRPWHHERRRCLWWVWNGSLGWMNWWLWCSCWGVGLLLLVCSGRCISRCGCRTVGVFFCHRRAGVPPHTLCKPMAAAAPQAAILTPLQAGATAVIILWRTSNGGWKQRGSQRK